MPTGIYVNSIAATAKRINQGFQFVAIASDIDFMINVSKQALSEVNALCGDTVGPKRKN